MTVLFIPILSYYIPNLFLLRVTWVASTSPAVSASGLTLTYQLEQSNNGGTTYSPVTLPSPTSTSYTTALATAPIVSVFVPAMGQTAAPGQPVLCQPSLQCRKVTKM